MNRARVLVESPRLVVPLVLIFLAALDGCVTRREAVTRVATGEPLCARMDREGMRDPECVDLLVCVQTIPAPISWIQPRDGTFTRFPAGGCPVQDRTCMNEARPAAIAWACADSD